MFPFPFTFGPWENGIMRGALTLEVVTGDEDSRRFPPTCSKSYFRRLRYDNMSIFA